MENKTSNNQKNSNEANSQLAAVFTCDYCEQEFDISYKCPECSDKVIEVESELPNLHWSGFPIEDEYVLGKEMEWTGNVCGNCCDCYKNKS
jgi:hypothetical protein